MIWLTKELSFPPISEAMDDGLLAFGGDLSEKRLLLAYRSGIFPWYNDDDPICWWSPDPRCILFPEKLKVSKSMLQIMKRAVFQFRYNENFEAVMRLCQTVKRNGQPGTWIHDEMINAYTKLHRNGFAICAEAWQHDQLVGGLYGVKLGSVFFGESMFSLVPNASKFAFIAMLQQMKDSIKLVDCQLPTNHLFSLGAEMISRELFTNLLSRHTTA